MANLKGSGKGGRKRLYGDLPLAERVKLSKAKTIDPKRKINFYVSQEEYQRMIKIEEESGIKFHAEFLTHLMDVYESTKELRRLIEDGKSL